jgi:hypothetical protein
MLRMSIIVLAGVSLACSDILPTRMDSVFMQAESPAATYSVVFKGDKERPAFGKTSSVVVDVVRNGTPYVWNESLHYGEAMDVSFAAGYPKYRWVGETILQLYHSDEFLESSKLVIRVENHSNRSIKFLKLFTSDKFLVFDLLKRSNVEFAASLPRGDFIGFYVEGQFDDDKRFQNGTSFEFKSVEDSCNSYLIGISDLEIVFSCT